MRKTLKTGWVAGLLCLGIPLTGLTLSQSIAIARNQSVAYKQEQQSLVQAKARLTQAKLNFLPAADLTWDHSSQTGLSTNTLSFGLSRTLTLNEADYFEYKFARVNLEKTEELLAEARRQTDLKAAGYFLDALNAQQKMELSQENLDLYTKTAEDAAALLLAGRKSELESRESELARVQAALDLNQAQEDLALARSALFTYLAAADDGQPLEDWSDLGSLGDFPAAGPTTERVQSELDLKSADVTMRQIKADNWPAISISYQYSWSNTGYPDDVIDLPVDHKGGTFGLTASYNLFSGLFQRQKMLSQRAGMRSLELARDDYDRHGEHLYSDLHRQYLNQLSRKNLLQQKLQLAVDNLAMASENFRLGRIGMLELEKAQTQRTDAALELDNQTRVLAKLLMQARALVRQPVWPE